MSWGCKWRHAPEARAEDFGDFEEISELRNAVGRRRVTFASLQWPFGGCHTCWGVGRWKSQTRMNMYLSPYVEEPLNSKVIKSFLPKLRSGKCFSCFGIPMFYVYMLWTLYVHLNIHVWLYYMKLKWQQIFSANYNSLLYSSRSQLCRGIIPTSDF